MGTGKLDPIGNNPIITDTDVLGGYHTVADVTARDAIPTERRKEGMEVRVNSPGASYRLGAGLGNGDWVLATAGATDADAIHDNVAGEIAAITLKGTPVSGDLLVIEDSADSNNKKRITIGTLPGDAVSSVFTRTGAVVAAASDYDASQVDFTPTGDIAASNVQTAIVEVRDDTDTKLSGKAATGHTHVEADITDLDHTDVNAIHDNVSSEIALLTTKTTPTSEDLLLIEDAAASNSKKSITVGALPRTGAMRLSVSGLVTGANVTGVVGVLHIMNTNGADRTYTLPAGPANGDRCGVQIMPASGSGNRVDILGALDIPSSTSGELRFQVGVNTNYALICGFTFLYNATRSKWMIDASVIIPLNPLV